MALDLSSIKTKLDADVSAATSAVDLGDKVADSVEGFLATLPAVGPEATQLVGYLDQFTKSLNALNSALESA
jgi:hypothetical protein